MEKFEFFSVLFCFVEISKQDLKSQSAIQNVKARSKNVQVQAETSKHELKSQSASKNIKV